MNPSNNRVDLRGPHDAGEIIGYAYRVYLRHFAAMFALGLTTVPLQMLAAVVQDRAGGTDGGTLGVAALQVTGVLVILLAIGALIFAVNDVVSGQRADFGRSLDAAFERFTALFSTNILGAVLAVLSVLAIPYFLARRRYDAACSIPYFIVRWTFGAQAVMVEGKRNWAALDASAAIVRGRWWRTLGILLLVGLIAAGPSIVAGAAQALPPVAAATIASGVSALVLPFVVGAQTLLYFDSRTRTLQAAAVAAPAGVPAGDEEAAEGGSGDDGDASGRGDQ